MSPTRPTPRESATRLWRGFARDGVKATSIRDVAAAAGVSPGLVQHHFATKAALREAVDERVLAIATESFRDFPEAGSAAEIQKELAIG